MWWVPIAIPVGFALWLGFIMWLVAHLCGWSALARRYRTEERFTGRKHHFRSGKIGWGNYNGCLTIGANADGLYLAVMFLLRSGHPPLFIPWTDISPRVVRLWLFGECLDLTTEKAPGTRIRLPAALGRKLAADANRAWGNEASTVATDPPPD